jgi:Na+/proline symporter
MSWLLAGILGYVALQLAVGVLVSRRIATEEDYLVAGRSLGPALAMFSVFATWFGAEACIGAAGKVYEHGLSGATHDPFAYALCILIMGVFLAGALWRRRIVTLADLFRDRYAPGVERIAVLLMAPTSLLWAAAQIRAFGQVLSASSELGLAVTITIAAVVVIVYTMAGGLLADAYTDLIQGAALVVGITVLAVVVVSANGGAGEVLAAIPPERLDLFASSGSWLDTAERWLVPVLGSLVAQELIARVVASRTAGIARGATVAAGFAYLLVGMLPVGLGLVGALALPGLDDGERILPLLAQRHLGTFLYVVFAGALVSAILSTVDSALLAVSAVVSHNLLVPLLRAPTEATKLRLARGVVVVAGLVAYALAFSSESIFGLVESASAFGGAGIAVITVFGLFGSFGGKAAGYAGILTGMTVQIAGAYALGSDHAYTWSLLASLTAYVVVAIGERTLGGGSRVTRDVTSTGRRPRPQPSLEPTAP